MHAPPLRRPWALLAATLLAALTFAGQAAASGGTYTQMLCTNPDSLKGTVGSNGVFPDGVTMSADHVNLSTLQREQRCAGNSGTRAMIMAAEAPFHLPQGKGVTFTYALPSDLTFKSASLWTRSNTAGGLKSVVARSNDGGLYPSPSFGGCDSTPGNDCLSRGSASDPYGAAGRIDIGAANNTMPQGFKWFLRCAWFGCDVTTSNVFNVYGGKVVIGDLNSPSGSLGGGDLASAGVLKGTEQTSLSATDGQSGVYRSRVVVDGVAQPWTVVEGGATECRDVNFGNSDSYEFNVRRPCPQSASGVAELDTTVLTEGTHRVSLIVEDAAGNDTSLMHDREVVVDNISPPSNEEVGFVEGSTRRGSTLAFTSGTWVNGGAAGEPDLTVQWERCPRTGGECTAIPGAGDELYTPTAADVGRRLRVVETATNSEGSTAAATERTTIVTEPDGTLPPPVDGTDNDCDGVVDEADEPGTCPPDGGGGGGEQPSGEDAKPLPPKTTAPAPTLVAPTVATSRSAAAGTPNGDGASPQAKLTAAFTKGGAKGRVDYGKTLGIRGRLVDPTGRPIRNAIIDISSTAALRGAKAAASAPVVTASDGSFTSSVTGKGGTRAVSFTYRYLREGAIVSRADLALTVRARVQLAVKLRGVIATYSGRVLAGAMPRGGKLVIVQGRAKGGSWQTFASRRASKSGKFKGRYRLKVRRPGKRLQFRVRVLAESGWNYVGVTSKPVTRRVK